MNHHAFHSSSSQKRLWWLGLLAGTAGVGLLLLSFAGYFHSKVPTQDNSIPTGQTIAADQITAVQKVVQPRFETAIGAIKPVHESNIASKILARIVEMNANAGKKVAAGDILVRLSDEELQSRLQQAEAEYEADRAQLQLAQTELERATQLVASNSISRAEYDTALTRVQTTQANANRAARAIEEARVFLGFATIAAPFDGVIVDKVVELGDTVSPGQVLMTMYDPSKMQLVANVRESLATQLKVGQQLPTRLESLGYECMATVSEVVPKADIASRSFEVKVSGPCPPGIYSGMFGRLLLPLEDEEILLIPSAAVQRIGQLQLVDIIDQQTVSRRAVQLGRSFGDQVEVLTGLREGEQVVVHSEDLRKENH